MPEGAKAVLQHLKLDIVSCCSFSWREAHNKMFLRRSVALDNLRKTLPPIDEDQRLALLHAPIKGTTLFGGELAKLQEANTKQAATFTVFPTPIAPPVSYSSRPYVRRGKIFSHRRGSRKSSGRGRGQGRSTSSATVTNLASLKRVRRPLLFPFRSTPINVKWSRWTMPLKPLGKTNVIFGGKVNVKSNGDVLPPQPAPVGGRLSEFVEGWKRITNDLYVLSIVT